VTVEATAPGKLVLIGEYAVLFGAPAAVMAIDRRAVVSIEPAAAGRWTVRAPGWTDATGEFELTAGGRPIWSDPVAGESTWSLVDGLLPRVGSGAGIRLSELPAMDVTLDTRAFFGSADGERRKMGLGSSAALTTALVHAFTAWPGSSPPPPTVEWVQRLVDLHRALQSGRGSGIDVAASVLGGVVRYRLDDRARVVESGPLTIPDGLQIRAVWTGRSASTSSFLARLEACRADHPGRVDRVIERLAEVASFGVEALSDGSGAALLAAVEEVPTTLDELGRVLSMPVLSDDHRRLWRTAKEVGVAYKPSGAGGGDVGLAFAPAGDRLDAFCRKAREHGFRLPELAIDPNGITVTAR
jgi:phosphomevalonate kinase